MFFKEMIDLATIKRKKVSTKAAQGQRKGLLHSKKFWLIFCIVFIILVAAGVTTGVLVAKYNKKTTTTKEDYLAKEYSYKDTTITFTKMTYEGIIMHLYPTDSGDGTYQKHIFYFAYDETQFYPDKAIDKGKDKDSDTLYYNQTNDEALKELIHLQFAINQWNNTILTDDDPSNDSEVAYLYIIDISKGNNSSLLSSSYFVPSGATNGSEFAFGYIAGEDGPKLNFEYESEDDTEILYTEDMNTFVTTVSANVRKFITKEFKLEIE